uniref:Uncharacterized protein n=1 Tax=Eutreptiella gymnastica TaxID=73025 RepID=A0A7S4GB82_9EUGL|mmetsp:Transcript_37817/g.61612  ORF Transcript_37817/g.61612 Transcript_37817/m.61612 type:complete len:116 (-) Transcript_37817:133-480(-)
MVVNPLPRLTQSLLPHLSAGVDNGFAIDEKEQTGALDTQGYHSRGAQIVLSTVAAATKAAVEQGHATPDVYLYKASRMYISWRCLTNLQHTKFCTGHDSDSVPRAPGPCAISKWS